MVKAPCPRVPVEIHLWHGRIPSYINLHHPSKTSRPQATGIITGTLIPREQGSKDRRDQKEKAKAMGTAHFTTLPQWTTKLGSCPHLHPHQGRVTHSMCVYQHFLPS